MTARAHPFQAALVLAWLALSQPHPTAADAQATRGGVSEPTVLGLRGDRFTLAGEATFLLGLSSYGALGASEDFIRRDLDDTRRHGFNRLRVWATWSAFDHDVSAVDTNSQPREPFLGRLRWLIAEADLRSLVVDVTLTRGKPGAS